MDSRILSTRIDARIMKAVKRFCIDNDIKMQTFIKNALWGELVLNDKEHKYVPKSIK